MTYAKVRTGLIVLAAVASLPCAPAWAQRLGNETVPGGVEAKPSMPDMTRPLPGAAPAPPAPATAMPPPIAAPAKPVMPAPPQPVVSPKKDGAADKGPAKKTKKKAASPRVMSRGIAPREAMPGAPSVGGDESKPGAVERQPGAPEAPQQ